MDVPDTIERELILPVGREHVWLRGRVGPREALGRRVLDAQFLARLGVRALEDGDDFFVVLGREAVER